jgi:hypothetical protein
MKLLLSLPNRRPTKTRDAVKEQFLLIATPQRAFTVAAVYSDPGAETRAKPRGCD